jgi:cytochrome c553
MNQFVTLVCTTALLSATALTAHAQGSPEAGKEKAAACAACHGETGNTSVPQYPNLAGQTARYLYLQLKDFKEGRRKDPLMSPMVASLSKQDMYDLAAYFSQQKPIATNYPVTSAKVTEGKQVADAALCTMCHLGGFSGQNEVPRVAGQHYEYVVKQLKDFRERRRTNDAGSMTAYAKSLTDDRSTRSRSTSPI